MTCTAVRGPLHTPLSLQASPRVDTPASAPGSRSPLAPADSFHVGRSHRPSLARCYNKRYCSIEGRQSEWGHLHCCLGRLEHCSRGTCWHSLPGTSSHTSLTTLSHSLSGTCWHWVDGTWRQTFLWTGWQTDLGFEVQLGLVTFLQPPGTCREQLIPNMPPLHLILANHYLHTHPTQQHLQSCKLSTFLTILQ